MSPPLVSIVIPSYNCSSFIVRTIESAARQTYANKELILVDDCSSDDSWPIICSMDKELASRFSGGFAFFRNNDNMGAHATINRAVQASHGSFIFILNADDLFEPSRLQQMMQEMLLHDSLCAFSSVHCIDAAEKPVWTELAGHFEALPPRVARYPFAAAASAVENICVSSGNLAFHRSVFEELGGFRDFLYVHDYDFFLRASLLTEPLFVPETAYLYRLHPNNTFRRLRKVGRAENLLLWLEVYAQVKSHEVKNAKILERPNYEAEFYAALSEYGTNKQWLYRHAGTHLAETGKSFLRRLLRFGA